MSRRRLGWLLGIAAGMSLGGVALHFSLRKPWGPPCLVRGRALGPVREVVAVQTLEEFLTSDLALDPSGEFQLAIPQGLPSPWIVIHGPGGAQVETAPLTTEGFATDRHELPAPMALWVSPLRVQRREETLRFDWAPIPAGEGFPEKPVYSLMVDYPRRGDPPRGESSLQAANPWMELSLRELLDQLPDLVREDVEVRLVLKVFETAERKKQDSPVWTGATATWKLGATDLTRPP